MVASVFARARLLVGAGVGTALDAAERASGTSLMRQALRELDDAATDTVKQRDAARRRGVRLIESERIGTERVATLGDQARFALREGRDELAKALLAEQIAVEAELAAIRSARDEASADEQAAEQAAADLKARRTGMAAELKAHEAVVASVGRGATGKIDRRVARAEESFERALVGRRNGSGLPPSPPRTTGIDALERERAVADRLAAMRAENGNAPPAKRRGKRLTPP